MLFLHEYRAQALPSRLAGASSPGQPARMALLSLPPRRCLAACTQLPAGASVLQLTSVNYVKHPRVPWEDDNVGTGDGWEVGAGGAAGGDLSLSAPGACATPGMGPFAARLVLGMGLTPPEELAWGCDPGTGAGIMSDTGEECVAPPVNTQPCPQGCRREGHAVGREPRQAEAAGPGKVPWCEGGTVAGRAGGVHRCGSPKPCQR